MNQNSIRIFCTILFDTSYKEELILGSVAEDPVYVSYTTKLDFIAQ